MFPELNMAYAMVFGGYAMYSWLGSAGVWLMFLGVFTFTCLYSFISGLFV